MAPTVRMATMIRTECPSCAIPPSAMRPSSAKVRIPAHGDPHLPAHLPAALTPEEADREREGKGGSHGSAAITLPGNYTAQADARTR